MKRHEKKNRKSLNSRSNKKCFVSFRQSKLGANPNIFPLWEGVNAERDTGEKSVSATLQVTQVTANARKSQKTMKECSKAERGKTDMKVRAKTSKVTLVVFPHSCKTFQRAAPLRIHSSNQFYRRNQYGWNIGLLWVATFSWGLCERSNVFS